MLDGSFCQPRFLDGVQVSRVLKGTGLIEYAAMD